MKPRTIKDNIFWLGAIDWDRRLFDSLIPLPDGTSYNAYLIQGKEKTALLDSVDPAFESTLMTQLAGIESIDFVISHHAEQDHSGTIPAVLSKYPKAKVITNPKCKAMLIDHLHIQDDRFITVDDGQEINLGRYTLRFLYTPWVHWPETMCTYVPESKILFSCDFFGSHLASSDLFVTDTSRVYEAAKRYYAEIMMPFRTTVKKNIDKLQTLEIEIIAPSHGSIYNNPEFILDAYKDWISDMPKNLVVIPYVSMHGSTKKMVEYLVALLTERGIDVQQFELTSTDLGKLAISLVDAATVVLGTPTVHASAHPTALYAAILLNSLRPKLKFVSVIGSYGWGSKIIEEITESMGSLKVELLQPVLCKGYPRQENLDALKNLAETITLKHKETQLLT